MQAIPIHDGKFLNILWDEKTRVIGIVWKEATSAMTDQDFKAELLYSVPKDKQGSWINMTVDPKGRLIVFRPIWPALSDHATSDQQIRW